MGPLTPSPLTGEGRACPVLDTGVRVTPPAVIPANSLPRTRYGAGIQGGEAGWYTPGVVTP